ncbi:MAG TPA: hypothetical protein VH951_10510, partial [Dehalococcoidia bacterium]
FGVFLAGGLLFGLCGLFLIYAADGPAAEEGDGRRALATLHAPNLTRAVGAALLLVSVLMLSGLGEAAATQGPARITSILCDLAWAGAMAAIAPVILALAEAISPGFLPRPVRQRLHLLSYAALAAWPFCFVLLRTTWGLSAVRELFLFISLACLLLLAAGARTLTRRHWRQSPTYTAAYVVSVPLLFAMVLFVLMAALPWALGRNFLLPSSVIVPAGCLLPLTLVYSALAGNWLTGLKTRAAATQVMLERHKAALASTRLLLHDHVLAEMKAMRGAIDVGEAQPADVSARMLAIEKELRAHLIDLDGDRPYNIPDAFPTAEDLREAVAQLAPGSKLEVRLDERSEAWPALVRWLFFCHAVSLIRNARLHGRATSIRIELVEERGEAVLIVDDDGLGFVEGVPIQRWTVTGIGLRAAQRDIEEEGGRLSLARSPQGGARIEERLPLPA